MPRPYSVDLRTRVIEEVQTGISRRGAAEQYGISPSVVIIWAQRVEATGSVAPKPSGGSLSPLEKHAEFLLGPKQPASRWMRSWRRCANAGSPAAAARCGGCSIGAASPSKKLCTRRSRSARTWFAPGGAGCASRPV